MPQTGSRSRVGAGLGFVDIYLVSFGRDSPQGAEAGTQSKALPRAEVPLFHGTGHISEFFRNL